MLNKIDLPAADPARVKKEIEDVIGLPALDAPEISAKRGVNIEAVLEDIVKMCIRDSPLDVWYASNGEHGT